MAKTRDQIVNQETAYDCCSGCQFAPMNIDDINKPCDVCQDDEYEQAEQEYKSEEV